MALWLEPHVDPSYLMHSALAVARQMPKLLAFLKPHLFPLQNGCPPGCLAAGHPQTRTLPVRVPLAQAVEDLRQACPLL